MCNSDNLSCLDLSKISKLSKFHLYFVIIFVTSLIQTIGKFIEQKMFFYHILESFFCKTF